MSDIESKLLNLGTEGLHNFIAQKGQQRKNALHQACQFQTSDWHNTQTSLSSIENTVAAKRQELVDFQNKQVQNQADAEKERASIEELRQQVADKEREVEQEKASGKKSQSYKDSTAAHLQRLTRESVKNVNKTLENDSPAGLISVLEIFVSVLRNKPNTKPVDVELFFKDFDKLFAKMGRMESTDCSFDLVDKNLKAIQSVASTVGDLDINQVYLDWTESFLQAAKIDLRMVKLLSELEDLKLQLQRAQLKLSRFDQMKEHTQQFNFESYFNQSISLLEDRAQNFSNIVATDERQAQEYQKELKGFNKAYFEMMMPRRE